MVRGHRAADECQEHGQPWEGHGRGSSHRTAVVSCRRRYSDQWGGCGDGWGRGQEGTEPPGGVLVEGQGAASGGEPPVCVHVCTCVSMHVCALSVPGCTCVPVYTACLRVHMHACALSVHMCAYVCTCVYRMPTCACVSICLCAHCAYMGVCMSVYMCVYACVHTCVYVSCICICENYMSLYMYIQTCDHTLPVFMCVCGMYVYLCICLRMCMGVCTHYLCLCGCACIYVHGCISVNMSVCTRVCMYENLHL